MLVVKNSIIELSKLVKLARKSSVEKLLKLVWLLSYHVSAYSLSSEKILKVTSWYFKKSLEPISFISITQLGSSTSSLGFLGLPECFGRQKEALVMLNETQTKSERINLMSERNEVKRRSF